MSVRVRDKFYIAKIALFRVIRLVGAFVKGSPAVHYYELDSRLGFGVLRRSTSCIHAVVRGNDDGVMCGCGAGFYCNIAPVRVDQVGWAFVQNLAVVHWYEPDSRPGFGVLRRSTFCMAEASLQSCAGMTASRQRA